MIRYTLVCEDGHRFESWFRNSEAFDDQSSARRLACPVCSSYQVAKAMMAPAIAGRRDARVDEGRMKAGQQNESQQNESQPNESQPNENAMKDMVLLDPESREVRALLRNVRAKVLAEGHDVGPRFATEARRIHEGAAPSRRIYGQASLGEARELIEDGILVLPLPIVPDELN